MRWDGKTQKEVLNKLNEIKYAINKDIYIEKNGIELVKIMEDIREEKFASNTISGGQYARLKWTINKIKNSPIGDKKIQDITKKDIQDFLNSIKDLSDSYIKKIYEQFVQAYHRAEIKKYISYNPMYEVIKPKSNKETKIVEALDINVQKAFTEYLNNVDIETQAYKNIFLIQMYMGLRIGEVLALGKENTNYIKRNEYKVAERGESWKFKLINAIDLSLAESSNKEEFIKSMNKLGYQVNWADNRKYITYTTPEGYKCRDNKLFDEKYLKETMEKEFRKAKEEPSITRTQSTFTNTKEKLLSLNNIFNGLIALGNISSNSQNINTPRKTIKGYRNLSKQAMKEYAMKQANASNFEWEEEEEM